jgi:hypothetical protein
MGALADHVRNLPSVLILSPDARQDGRYMRKVVETLAAIDAPHFFAGIVLWDDGHSDRVVEAAPIVGYMKKGKWSRARVRSYCQDKGWRISVVWQMERHLP